MVRNRKIVLFIIGSIGLIVPFIPYFVIFEFFFLLIPYFIIFIGTLTYLLISLFNKQFNTKTAIFIFLIVPVFIISQLASGQLVDKIQRLRSNKIIFQVESIKTKTGHYPEEYNLIAGIEYYKTNKEESFVLKYSRGFMITEKYFSKYNHWGSYGWND